jgi:hypothetical protein
MWPNYSKWCLGIFHKARNGAGRTRHEDKLSQDGNRNASLQDDQSALSPITKGYVVSNAKRLTSARYAWEEKGKQLLEDFSLPLENT